MTALLSGLDLCLSLADKLDLQRVAIQIDQARSYVIQQGGDGDSSPRAIPRSFTPPRATSLP